jgi:hypothetical protein
MTCGRRATDFLAFYLYQTGHGERLGRSVGEWAMVSEGRLLWLTPLEWSLLLVSAALCGCLSLVVGA